MAELFRVNGIKINLLKTFDFLIIKIKAENLYLL